MQMRKKQIQLRYFKTILQNHKTLKHLDIYRSGIYFQVNEEFFESGAIAQVIEDKVDDVNCICSVRLQYHVSYLLWREIWQNLHL